jgi:outer membrane lipoprotein
MSPPSPHRQTPADAARGRLLVRLARLSVGAVLASLILGCASPVPQAIRESGTTTPVTVSAVQADPARHSGQRVRWGGEILSVANRERVTEIEILSRRLGREGEPVMDAEPEGRFIASIPGFVDPAQIPNDRDITVVGLITETVTRPVGEYPYIYPVVQVESRYLWPEAPPAVAYPYPYPWLGPWYDPFWGPYWGPGYRLGGGAWMY